MKINLLGSLALKAALVSGVLCGWTANALPTPDSISTDNGALQIYPINHATLALQWNGKTIYLDPVGGGKAFEGFPKPDLVLVTDIHGDHLDKETLGEVSGRNTKIVAPAAVVEQLPSELRGRTTTLANGETSEVAGIKLEAVPMYNLTPDRLKFHN